MSDDHQQTPGTVEVFDPARRRRAAVDRETPFFSYAEEPYGECNHRDVGVVLDRRTREVFCKCGTQIDLFDALLIYAHAEQRLIHHATTIQRHEDREREQREERALKCVRDVVGRIPIDRDGVHVGYILQLACGHDQPWDRPKRAPRRATCRECLRIAKARRAEAATEKTDA